MNSLYIIGFDPYAEKYLHQVHRFRCHFSTDQLNKVCTRCQEEHGGKDRKAATEVYWENRQWVRVWAMSDVFVSFSIWWTWYILVMISLEQERRAFLEIYVPECMFHIHLNRLRIVCQRITHDPSRSCIITDENNERHIATSPLTSFTQPSNRFSETTRHLDAAQAADEQVLEVSNRHIFCWGGIEFFK